MKAARKTVKRSPVNARAQKLAPEPRPDPTRKIHRMARTVVDHDGTAHAKALHAAFDHFNVTYFEGKIASPMLRITPAGSPRAEGDYQPRDHEGVQGTIRIAPSRFRLTTRIVDGAKGEKAVESIVRKWRSDLPLAVLVTLLHECVHAYCHEVLNEPEKGYRGHGPVFAIQCNRIGSKLGVPTVYPKSRERSEQNLARCEEWPHLPVEFVDPKKKPKAPKGAAREDEGEGEESEGNGPSAIEMAVEGERERILTLLEHLYVKHESKNRPTSARAVRRAHAFVTKSSAS